MKPRITKTGDSEVSCTHETLNKTKFYWGTDQQGNSPKLLFTENETNSQVRKNLSYSKQVVVLLNILSKLLRNLYR